MILSLILLLASMSTARGEGGATNMPACTGQTLTLTSDDPDAWIFNVTMGFGLTNTSEGLVNTTEFYSNVTYNVTNSDGNVTFEYN